jgi:RNA polymerase sigma-54 factor
MMDMDMDMTSEVQQAQQMTVRISPRLIAANHILELSSMELQEVMQQEVDENPALEVTEYVNCPRCGSLMLDDTCHTCARAQNSAGPEPATFDVSEAYLDTGTWHATSTGNREEEFDPLSLVAAQMSLSERLLVDLAPLLASPLHERIAEYLIGNLDDNGFLCCSVAEVAAVLNVAAEEVEEVLARLQTLEPIGIGARTLQECLLIQLKYLESQGYGNPTAFAIVRNHFDELGAHKYGRIAHALGLGQEDVIAVAHYIRDKLNPFPAQQYGSRPRSAPAEIPRYVLPDLVIRQGEEGLEVDVVESRRFVLRISPSYQDMWREVEGRPRDFSERDREHIRHYITRAKMFMANLNQRRQTMQKIGDFLAEYQQEFLVHGIRYLKPLTRAMVAQYTGMHESTVSRATAGKWVMIPTGKVIPFSDFFTPALNVKDVIKELIEAEVEPLTDQQITERLAAYGHHIARRTVAKYRDQLGILPSSLRG